MVTQLEESVSRVGFENPFYVVVHAEDARIIPNSSIIDVPKFCKVHFEIDFIRLFEDYRELGRKVSEDVVLDGIPKDRPVLVCGFFGDDCVRKQRDALRRTGYDAYICKEATYF